MANVTTTQVLQDGPRNTTLKVEGVLDTSDLAAFTIADPSTLAGMDNTGAVKAAKFRIGRITYNVQDALVVNLLWDATTPQRIEELAGRGKMEFSDFGGLTNNAGAGVTGKILLSTRGFAAGQLVSFTVVLELIKQGT